MIIQYALAHIQKSTARLWNNSAFILRVCQVMSKAAEMVGTIMKIPNGFQSIAQLRSFSNQKTIWRFSILRNRSGIQYSRGSLFILVLLLKQKYKIVD